MLLQKLLRLTRGKTNRSHFSKPISTSARLNSRAYDGVGQSYVDLLDAQRHPDLGLLIAAFSQVGFRLSNGIYCVGPIVMFSRSVLSWDVGGPFDITPESLSLFTRLEPKLDILVLGIGDNLEFKRVVEKQIFVDVIKKSGINVEIEITQHACSTYNFLCTEHRLVAGAFIPPRTVKFTDDDIIDSKIRYDSLYDDLRSDRYLEDTQIPYKKEQELLREARRQLEEINKEWFEKLEARDPYAVGVETTDKEKSEVSLAPKSYYEMIEEKEQEELKRIGAKEEERKQIEQEKDKEGFKFVGKREVGKEAKLSSSEKRDADGSQNLGERSEDNNKLRCGKETKKGKDLTLDDLKHEPIPDPEAEEKKNLEREREAENQSKEINKDFFTKQGVYNETDSEYSQLNSPPKSYYEQIAEKEEEEKKKMAEKQEESNGIKKDNDETRFQSVKLKKAKRAQRDSKEQKDKKDDS